MDSLLGIEVLLAVLTLIIYMLCAQWIDNTRIEYLHESALAIGLGAIGGLIVYFIDDNQKIEFSTGIFFYFVLPPIIFSAGYNLKSRNFFINIGSITLYGFIGTFLCFTVLGLLGIFFNYNGALPPD